MKRTDLDLASRALGGSVRFVSDEFFAPREALIQPWAPLHDKLEFGPHGKIYDGWETRRRRTPGYDWAVVALGIPGVLHEIVVDTAFFTGNYPPEVSWRRPGWTVARRMRNLLQRNGSQWCPSRRPAATPRIPIACTTTGRSAMSG